jgi:signal transduction histidine kinase
MLRLLIVLFFLTGPFIVFGQESQVDSLLTLVSKAPSVEARADLFNEVATAYYDYDVARGLEYAEKALQLSESVQYGPGIRTALTLKGYYFFDTGDFRKALELYQQSRGIGIPDDERLGYNYVMTGNVYRSIASYDSAEYYYKEAITLLQTLKAPRFLAFAYRNAGRLCVLQWKNAEAEEYFKQALEIYTNLKNRFGMADVFFGMAELNKNRAEYDVAQQFITKGCTLANELGDDYLQMHCLIFTGEIQFRKGEFLPSLESLLQAVELLKRKDNPHTLARVYGDLGDVYETLGQNDVALRYHFEAMKIGERLGLKYELGKHMSNIAWIYKNQRNFESAFDFLEKSLKIRSEIGDVFGVSNCYNVKGIIYFQQKKYGEAIRWLENALQIREKIGHKEGVSACLYNLGLVFEEQKEYQKALEYQYKALHIEKDIGNKFNIGIAFNSIGSLYTHLARYDSASAYLAEAEKLGKGTGSLELQMENCFYWSEYFEMMGNPSQALAWHKKYANLNDSVYYENSATKLAEMQALYQTDQKDKEIQLLNQEKLLQSNQIQLQVARISLQNFIIIFIIVALLLVSLLAYKSYQYNKEIRTAHGEIVSQKEEIQAQASELQKAYLMIAESHKELEAKVAERTTELREAYRELDTFFYRASHDFRRPLTTFLGLVEVANITVKDASALELFEKVRETATNLDKMLLKLQAISDLGSQQLQFREVHLPEILNEVIEAFRLQIEEKNIRTYTSCVLPRPFFSYPAMIHMIVENLVENSISFCRYEKAVIKLKAYQNEETVFIEVEDNGDGVHERFHSRIFEMYFRGNERSKGNGLGLYIVKKAVEKLGGSIEFRSSVDKGTVFKITLPLTVEPLLKIEAPLAISAPSLEKVRTF